MYIKSLKLQNFRNYADESFAFDPAVNLICGENGQGKTNLLEAAAACSTMRLFRTAQKKEGLRFGENHAFIFADFLAQERDISLELRFSRTKAMEIYKNGVRQKRQSDAQGLLKTVLFCPEDLMLVRAGAAARRRFLDTALCQMRPNYARYLEVLSGVYKTVSSVTDPFADARTIEKQLIDHVFSHKTAEIAAKSCLSGPHKDDLELLLDGRSAASFGSQGQVRTCTLSLKLAERELFFDEDGEYPVLLLDDVLSELDRRRQDFVLNRISAGQVMITCCEDGISEKLRAGAVFHIQNGEKSTETH